jgi:hypothetical protein
MSKKDIRREHSRKQKLAQRMAARFVRDEMPEIWEDIRRAVGIDVDWANQCKPRRKRQVKKGKR